MWIRAIACLLCALGAVHLQSMFAQGPTTEDWDWVNQHFKKALDDVMPIPDDVRLKVGVRSHRDLYKEVPEYSFLIRTEPAKEPVALVRIADGKSIYDQIMALHRQDPSMAIEEIEKRIRIKAWEFTATECPAVLSSLDTLDRVKFSLPRSDLIILHPLVYEFKINAMTGHMDLELWDEQHPLVKWAEGTRAAFQKCISDKDARLDSTQGPS